MDKRPKRRKFKDNPYTLESKKDENIFFIIFKDNNGLHKVKVNEDIFNIFDESEKYENARYKEYSIHIEHSEIDFNKKCKTIKSLEDEVIEKLKKEEIKKIINNLTNIQRKRIIKYYFENKTLKEIAFEENCSKVAIKYSIDIALETIKKQL